jgi:CP family cyanate transporter-like MFS transporter
LRGPRLALLAGLFLAALSLRPQLVGIGPLIPAIQSDLDISHAIAGLLGTIPVFCMGLFAPPAPYLSRRLGSRTAIAGCLGLIAAFGIARALVPGAAGVILLTFPVGVGIGFAQALMPVAVKERFAHRPAFATGIYATGISTGSAISTAIAVPVAHAAGGWRGSLTAFSAFTGLLFVAWVVLTRREPPHARTAVRPVRLPWGNVLAWRLAAMFGLMGIVYYGVHAWLPDSYVERGWSESTAGSLLAVLNVAALPPAVLVPWFADRIGSRRFYLVAGGLFMFGAMLGVVLLPGGGFVWAALLGISTGILFPLVLTLPLDLAERPAQVGAIAGMMLGAGYTFSAVSPFALGAVRDATASFRTALWLLVGAAGVFLALVLPISQAHIHRHRTRFAES